LYSQFAGQMSRGVLIFRCEMLIDAVSRLRIGLSWANLWRNPIDHREGIPRSNRGSSCFRSDGSGWLSFERLSIYAGNVDARRCSRSWRRPDNQRLSCTIGASNRQILMLYSARAIKMVEKEIRIKWSQKWHQAAAGYNICFPCSIGEVIAQTSVA
jgi:hypothetical protein